MNSTQNQAASIVDTKLEVVVIPVSDVDRAKSFYTGLGWRVDATTPSPGIARLQVTRPIAGSVSSKA